MKSTISFFLLIQFNFLIAQEWQWAHNWNLKDKSYASSIGGCDKEGNLYCTSSVQDYIGSGGNSIRTEKLFKFDGSNGKIMWEQDLAVVGSCLSCTNKQGETFIAGNDRLAKYNSDGEILWLKYVKIEGYFFNLVLHPNGNFVVNGGVRSEDTLRTFLAMYDPDGNMLWTRWGSHTRYGGVLACDNKGLIYIANMREKNPVNGNAGYLTKYDSKGYPLIELNVPHCPTGMEIDNGDNIYLTGQFSYNWPITLNNLKFECQSSKATNYFLIKYSPQGNLIWYKIIEGSSGNFSIALDETNNLYFIKGYSKLKIDELELSSISSENFICKFNPSGERLWWTTSKGNGQVASNYPVAIAVCNNGDVYHAGAMTGTHHFGPFTLTADEMYSEFVVGKISQDNLVSIKNISKTDELNLMIFPNPSSNTFYLKYSVSNPTNILINVIDSKGQNVYSEIITIPESDFTKTIDLRNYSRGIYLVEVINGTERSVQKIVLE
jgi:hypothetical protein